MFGVMATGGKLGFNLIQVTLLIRELIANRGVTTVTLGFPLIKPNHPRFFFSSLQQPALAVDYE